MKSIMFVFSILFIMSFSTVANSGNDNSDQVIHVHVSDVMKVFQRNYFKAEKLSEQPEKYKALLNDEIEQLHFNFEKIVSLNKNKDLRSPLRKLKQQLRKLQKASIQNDREKMRRVFGNMYMTCFKCHNTNRESLCVL